MEEDEENHSNTMNGNVLNQYHHECCCNLTVHSEKHERYIKTISTIPRPINTNAFPSILFTLFIVLYTIPSTIVYVTDAAPTPAHTFHLTPIPLTVAPVPVVEELALRNRPFNIVTESEKRIRMIPDDSGTSHEHKLLELLSNRMRDIDGNMENTSESIIELTPLPSSVTSISHVDSETVNELSTGHNKNNILPSVHVDPDGKNVVINGNDFVKMRTTHPATSAPITVGSTKQKTLTSMDDNVNLSTIDEFTTTTTITTIPSSQIYTKIVDSKKSSVTDRIQDVQINVKKLKNEIRDVVDKHELVIEKQIKSTTAPVVRETINIQYTERVNGEHVEGSTENRQHMSTTTQLPTITDQYERPHLNIKLMGNVRDEKFKITTTIGIPIIQSNISIPITETKPKTTTTKNRQPSVTVVPIILVDPYESHLTTESEIVPINGTSSVVGITLSEIEREIDETTERHFNDAHTPTTVPLNVISTVLPVVQEIGTSVANIMNSSPSISPTEPLSTIDGIPTSTSIINLLETKDNPVENETISVSSTTMRPQINTMRPATRNQNATTLSPNSTIKSNWNNDTKNNDNYTSGDVDNRRNTASFVTSIDISILRDIPLNGTVNNRGEPEDTFIVETNPNSIERYDITTNDTDIIVVEIVDVLNITTQSPMTIVNSDQFSRRTDTMSNSTDHPKIDIWDDGGTEENSESNDRKSKEFESFETESSESDERFRKNEKIQVDIDSDEFFVPQDIKERHMITVPNKLPPEKPGIDRNSTKPITENGNQIDHDADTIFYISNTEVKVGESHTGRNGTMDLNKNHNPPLQFFPAPYEEDVIIDFRGKNISGWGPIPDKYEEDIILSPLKRSNLDVGNPKMISDDLSISYVGESFIDVKEATLTTTTESDNVITGSVIIEPVQIPIDPIGNIGVPVIGALPPQIELREIDYSIERDDSDEIYGGYNHNVAGKMLPVTEPLINMDNVVGNNHLQRNNLIADITDSDMKRTTGEHTYLMGITDGDEEMYNKFVVPAKRSGNGNSSAFHNITNTLTPLNVSGNDTKSINKTYPSHPLVHLKGMDNRTFTATTVATIQNASAFTVMDDESEITFNDIQTLLLACLATVVPLVFILLLLFGIRHLWQKYRIDQSGNVGLIGDNSTDPLAIKSRNESTEEIKSSQTDEGYTVNPTDTIGMNGNGTGLMDGLINGDDRPIVTTDIGITPANKTNHSGANGSVITMTLKNNHLIVETEERNDMARNTRETKMHYSPSEKDGVFVVEVVRGADTTNEQIAFKPREDRTEPIVDQNQLIERNDDQKPILTNGPILNIQQTNGNVDQQEDIRPTLNSIDNSTDELLTIDEDGGISASSVPLINGTDSMRPVCGSTNTGLSQSDLSISSSTGSNQAYCYGSQEPYGINDTKEYETVSPHQMVTCQSNTSIDQSKPIITAAIYKQDTIDTAGIVASYDRPNMDDELDCMDGEIRNCNKIDNGNGIESGDMNGETFDSLINLPEPPSTEEIKHLQEITIQTNNNLDSLPPPPPEIVTDIHINGQS